SRSPDEREERDWPRPPPAGAVQYIGLVPRHVDARGTVSCARLARQAELERPPYPRAPIIARDDKPVDHLLEDPCAPARAVRLIARRGKGRAHEAGAEGVVGAALSHPDAAVDGDGEVAVVVGEGEAVAVDHGGSARSAQVLVQRGGV